MKRITSFSFKGGAGRTVSAANIAAVLAARGNKVACVDLDIEAPGLHYVFEIEEYVESEKQLLQYYLRGTMSLEELLEGGFIDVSAARKQLSKDLYPIGRGGSLHYMGSRPEAATTDVVGYNIEYLLINLADELEGRGFDFLIIDSPSGLGSLAAVAIDVADWVLWFLRLGIQHIKGTLWLSDFFVEARQDGGFPDTRFQLIPCAVPSERDLEIAKQMDGINKQAQLDITTALDLAKLLLDKRGSEFGQNPIVIPESMSIKWKEQVVKGPGKLQQAYELIADKLEES